MVENNKSGIVLSSPIKMRDSDLNILGLYDLISYLQNIFELKKCTIVEIGSYQGESTEIFAKFFKTVYAIDTWKNGFDPNPIYEKCDMKIVEKSFDDKMIKHKNVIKIKDTSKNVSLGETFKNSTLDVVYIDGDHNYESVKEDIECWLPKIKQNGVISGHDYNKNTRGVIDAVNEFFVKPDKVFKDYSWVVSLKK